MPTTYIGKHTIARTVDGVRVNHSPGTEFPSKGVPALSADEAKRLKQLGAIVAKGAKAADDGDGDGDGDDNATKQDREALVARAKELGIKGVNKNWGEEKLQAAIAEAEAAAGDDGL